MRIHIPTKKETQFTVTETLINWLLDLPKTYKSFTGTMYIPCRVRTNGDKVRVQIASEHPLNRKWGCEFEHEDATVFDAMISYKPPEIVVEKEKPVKKPTVHKYSNFINDDMIPEIIPSLSPNHHLIGKKIMLLETPLDSKGGFGPKKDMTGTVVTIQPDGILGVLFDKFTTGQNNIAGAKGCNGWYVSEGNCVVIADTGPKTIASQQAEKAIKASIDSFLGPSTWWKGEKAP